MPCFNQLRKAYFWSLYYISYSKTKEKIRKHLHGFTTNLRGKVTYKWQQLPISKTYVWCAVYNGFTVPYQNPPSISHCTRHPSTPFALCRNNRRTMIHGRWQQLLHKLEIT